MRVSRLLSAGVLATTLALALAACGGGSKSSSNQGKQASNFRGGVLNPAVAPPDFSLRDQNGKLVRVSAQRGHFAIVTFLYTNCPDVCPLIASNLNQALRELGAGVSVLAVSVDPKRDTPSAVRQFVRLHRLVPQFHYLTGTRAQLAKVWKAYGILVRPGKLETVDHAAYEMLIDPSGRARLLWSPQAKTGDVVHDIRALRA